MKKKRYTHNCYISYAVEPLKMKTKMWEHVKELCHFEMAIMIKGKLTQMQLNRMNKK